MRPFLRGFASELTKLAFHEGWGLGGEWNAYPGPAGTDNAVISQEAKPSDVELKNERAEHFLRRRQPIEEGKVPRGKLSNASSE